MTDFSNAQPDLVVQLDQPAPVSDEMHLGDEPALVNPAGAMARVASLCAEAAISAVQGDPAIEPTQLRQDAAAVLTALSHMLARPLEPARLASVHAAVEAGITVATDCAVESRSSSGEEVESDCASACEACAQALHEALVGPLETAGATAV